ncbi:hypothetical protein KVR01_007119 [Diaporthe batatas]|uniref:uncharacterized protein n=1 Tax=Diaporthe batatas TaxID=748121 RepID=UPI001D049A58|nr:uncharacterized protein KVR01_007119 [Diaporthe batatas]KAG8162641.1 hypothetical protein KVR01_007119 [Diaporthe batatas]
MLHRSLVQSSAHPALAMAPIFSLSTCGHRVATLTHATYHVGPHLETIVKSSAGQNSANLHDAFKPTVLLSVGQRSTNDSLRQDIETFRRDDDVFSDDFLTDSVLVQGVQGWNFENSQINWGGLGIQTANGYWNPTDVMTVQTDLPPGPYFLTAENKIAQAWRLYPDVQDAFATTFVPSEDDPGRFEPLELTGGKGLWRQVAVPSRLYSIPTKKRPLAGKRISIKDNFKIAGVQTTQNNRAWCSLYGVENETAKYAQQLITLGAIIVRKTKMCSFASSEEATDQWIDIHAPFNPRGDGYQSPSGSTTGGGASLATYDWLDYSIGTDTSGSIRWPAAYNGLFGMRVSTGTDTLEGIYPACRWSQCPPPEAEGKDFKTYIDKTAYYPFYYDGFNEFSQFRKDYEQKFDKPVYHRDRGAEVSLKQKEQSLKELEVYRRWFHDAVMKPEAGGGSDAILILPVGSGDPKYRDEPNSTNYIGSMQGLAQIVVPVGQTPYESRISKRTEYNPIVASMASAPGLELMKNTGSDLMLVALAKAVLEGAQRPTKVETGRFMFKL